MPSGSWPPAPAVRCWAISPLSCLLPSSFAITSVRWATVAQKIATNLRTLGATRFDLKYGMPGLSHDQPMANIELYGGQVIPRVRELLS